MIPSDPDTLAAWQEYERLNTIANFEYRHRLTAVSDADKAAQRLRLAAASSVGDAA